MSQSRTLLGFDYGKKKIGIAVGQELTASSSPLETLYTTNNEPDWTSIGKLIDEWRATGLVVGIPYNMDDSEHEMTRSAKRFADKLKERYQLPVYTVDERLSSVEAERMIGESGKKTRNLKQKKALVDQVAAQVILNTYFNQQRIDHDKKCG
jgi:putative Holliday junction resolvase